MKLTLFSNYRLPVVDLVKVSFGIEQKKTVADKF